MARRQLRDLIILLPGILGSVLQKDGRDLWAISGQAAWRALGSLGRSLQDLRLIDGGPGAVRATSLMAGAHILPGLLKVDGYAGLVRMIVEGFEVQAGSIHDERPANFIEFPYDWRLDNRVSARALKSLVDRRLEQWREHSGFRDAKVIFVVHSMGGLVARYYVEVLGGWRECRALISLGTPYRGAPQALNYLANGYKNLFLDLTEVMRSFPAVYQLLPIYRALKVDEDHVRVAEGPNIAGIDPFMATDALTFHREIEEAVRLNLAEPAYVADRYQIMPVIGARQPTLQGATFAANRVVASNDLPAWMDSFLAGGDGTVPRASAIPIEMSDAPTAAFVAERHGSLQADPHILEDVRGRLEQLQVRNLRAVRAPETLDRSTEPPAFALELEDLYLPDEPVTVRARVAGANLFAGAVQGIVEPVDAPAGVATRTFAFEGAGGDWILSLNDLPPGLYRLSVLALRGGPNAPRPIHDLFEVGGR